MLQLYKLILYRRNFWVGLLDHSFKHYQYYLSKRIKLLSFTVLLLNTYIVFTIQLKASWVLTDVCFLVYYIVNYAVINKGVLLNFILKK